MILTKLKRVMRAGFIGFWRNGFVSLASVLVMTVTLFTITGVIFSGALLETSLEQIKNKVNINVYFITDAPESEILSLQKTIDTLPEVEETTYISKEQALTIFKERHATDQTILQVLNELEGNPLRAILTIKAKDPSHYGNIAKFLQSDMAVSGDGTSIIDKTNYVENQVAIERLSKIVRSADQIGLILTIVFILLSVLITFNTIRLAIFTARDEIGVMQLMGASSKYIRGPFVIMGMMYGIISAIITLSILYPLTFWIGPFTQDFFVGINLFTYYLSHFGQIFLIIMGSGIIIGAVSSFLSVRKYLKV